MKIPGLDIITQGHVRRGLVWALTFVLVFTAVWVVIGTVDFRNEGIVKDRLVETHARAQALASENAILRLRILELRLGTREAERAAREEHGLVRPDEVLYVFEDHQ